MPRFDDLSKYKTLFIVGLFSNPILLSNLNRNKIFSLIQPKNNSKNFIKIADKDDRGLHRSPVFSKKVFHNTNDEEYGLIAKLKHDDTNIFVIGGIDARLTVECSKYFVENWKSIYDLYDNFDIQVKDKDFAICMKSYKNEALTFKYKFAQNQL